MRKTANNNDSALRRAQGAGAAVSRADANEYTQITRNSSNQNPAHDKNGNMTTLPTRPATGAAAGTNVSTAITFDAFNRPFTAQASGNGVQDYRYDALGRRIAAMELSGGNITAGRRFVWDSWSVATERLLSGTTGNCDSLLERCYVEGASLDEHLFAAIDCDLDGNLSTNLNVPVSAGTTNTNDYEYYYLQNRLGSVMGLLDATDDRYMLEFYRYTIYGEATVLPLYDTGLNSIEDTPTDLSDNNSAMLATRTGGGGDATAGRASTFNNQYTFTGRYLDAETGLHYYRFRYYEARTGRFISRDPIESPWTNTYSYCENGPTLNTDPLGLVGFSVIHQCKSQVAGTPADAIPPVENNLRISFDNCTEADAGDIAQSICDALTAMLKARRALELRKEQKLKKLLSKEQEAAIQRLESAAKTNFTDGKDELTDKHYDQIKAVLDTTIHEITNSVIEIKCTKEGKRDDPEGSQGGVARNFWTNVHYGPILIHNPFFAGAGLPGRKLQAGWAAHEMTHRFANTQDEEYLDQKTGKYKKKSGKLVNNADSYEELVKAFHD